MTLPFEFVIPGIPVSQQTRNRKKLQRWKCVVYQHAKSRWPQNEAPHSGNLSIRVVYYYEGVPLDTDNMIKPIQDALIGLVYSDDNQITDVVARKRALDGSFRVKGMSKVLAEGFTSGKEFLHVRVEEAPNPEELL